MKFTKLSSVFSEFNPTSLNKELAELFIESDHDGYKEGNMIKLRLVFKICLTPFNTNQNGEILKSTTIGVLPAMGKITVNEVYSEFKDIIEQLINKLREEEKRKGLSPIPVSIPSLKDMFPEIISLIHHFFPENHN